MSNSSQKKATTKKRTQTAKKRTTKASSKSQKKTQEFEAFYTEIILWIVIALAALLLLGNFGLCGTVGNVISSVFFGTFGVVQHILPVITLILVGILLANDFSTLAVKKTLITILFLSMCSTIAQMVVDFDATSVFAVVEQSYEKHIGGGFIGGAIMIALKNVVGKVGASLVVVVIMLISLILIFEKSVLKILKEAGIYTVHASKQQREAYKVRKEENAIRKRQSAEPLNYDGDGTFRDNLLKKEEKAKSKNRPKRKMVDIGEKFGLDITFEGTKDPHVPLKSEVKADTPPSWFDTLPVEEVAVSEVIPVNHEVKELSFDEPEQDMKPAVEEIKPAEDVTEETKKVTKATKPAMDLEVSNQVTEDLNKAAKVEEKPYVFPPYNLMSKGEHGNSIKQQKLLRETAMKLQQTLENFGVHVTITDVSCGPSITRYELQPEQGVKVSKIVGLADDIKLNLAAADIRIEAPIPGKAAIGIEVPNKHSETVKLRDLLESDAFKKAPSNLAIAIGKDIAGNIIIGNIAKMPHVLIAGATGSGKSVFINTLITSILYKADPNDVKFIMIDPKVVELSTYNGIPHLLIPVVTDAQKAAGALNWAVMEMTDRYNKFAEYGVRNLEGYNKKVEEVLATGDVNTEQLKKLPQIVIIVDELADLMMVAPGEVEGSIVRLSQLARAAGIHLVIATQRPSVNVITGLIKANVPSRIAFAVSSGVDSRTIIDMNGAEKLLGNGDMLYAPYGQQKPVRVQGAFISDKEVGAIVDFLKENNDQNTQEDISKEVSTKIESSIRSAAMSDEKDELFEEAAKFIVSKEKASIGMIQRMFKVGFNRASRIMEQLADAGVVGPEEGTKPRKILMSEEQLAQYLEEYL